MTKNTTKTETKIVASRTETKGTYNLRVAGETVGTIRRIETRTRTGRGRTSVRFVVENLCGDFIASALSLSTAKSLGGHRITRTAAVAALRSAS